VAFGSLSESPSERRGPSGSLPGAPSATTRTSCCCSACIGADGGLTESSDHPVRPGPVVGVLRPIVLIGTTPNWSGGRCPESLQCRNRRTPVTSAGTERKPLNHPPGGLCAKARLDAGRTQYRPYLFRPDLHRQDPAEGSSCCDGATPDPRYPAKGSAFASKMGGIVRG
jgi:hypothetical protein